MNVEGKGGKKSAYFRVDRRRADKFGSHESSANERWLLTYADMITLLLVLFIVLYAISTINEAKFKEFKQSVTHTQLFRTPRGTTNAPSNSKSNQPSHLSSIEKALSGALKKKGLLQDVTFDLTSTGLVEGLVGDSTFFLSNSASLSVTGYQIVDTSAGVLKKYHNAIEVAGYTDNRPISSGPFADNWALSAARAAAVVVRMSTGDGVDPTQLILLGYGQYHPVASNATSAGQAQNRRVNIVISPTSKPVSQ